MWEHQKRIRLEYKKGHPTTLAQLLQWPTVKQEHWRKITKIRIQRKEQEKVSPSFAGYEAVSIRSTTARRRDRIGTCFTEDLMEWDA
jgi:hypothetical protein